MDTNYIYKIKVNSRVYFGRTYRPSRRKLTHIWELRNNRHHNAILQRSFNRNNSFSFTILFNVSSVSEAVFWEQLFIDKTTNCNLNSADSGSGSGTNHYFYGKNHSKETRLKIGKTQKGKPKIGNYCKTKEHRDKISNSLKGHKQGKETINKRIDSCKKAARKRYKHKFYHPVEGEIICTRIELIEGYNLNSSNVSGIISGKRKTHKGWTVK